MFVVTSLQVAKVEAERDEAAKKARSPTVDVTSWQSETAAAPRLGTFRRTHARSDQEQQRPRQRRRRPELPAESAGREHDPGAAAEGGRVRRAGAGHHDGRQPVRLPQHQRESRRVEPRRRRRAESGVVDGDAGAAATAPVRPTH